MVVDLYDPGCPVIRHIDGWFANHDAWYRTDHKQPRLHKGKEFNRETVHSLVRCMPLSFKVISVDMSMGASAPPPAGR